MLVERLDKRQIEQACVRLSRNDPDMAFVYNTYGTPPLWDRPTGFGTLLNIILEQQVSLGSAKACFDKLAAHLGEVSPQKMLTVNDADLRTIGFSRQKTAYARHLSEAILAGRIDLEGLEALSDADAKAELVKLKGVGEWTSDVYLLMAMLRPDVMPRGDIALHSAFKQLTKAEIRPSPEEFVVMALKWKPFRSVAARLLWHYYLSERRKHDP